MEAINAVLQGFQLALVPTVEAYWLENPRPDPRPAPNPAYAIPTPEQPKPRRHSRKGEATGWIEERQGNKHRQHPSISYYYRYYDADGRKAQQYVQVHLMGQIRQMIDQRCSVEAVLKHIHTHSRRKEPKS